jgi:hypothetical protein
VEEIQQHGYRADDILFLCRTNEEGKSIINRILEYSSSCLPEKLKQFNYEVTSGESLFLERNPAVTLLLSSLRYLTDPGSLINRSLMLRSYVLAAGKDESLIYDAEVSSNGKSLLPEVRFRMWSYLIPVDIVQISRHSYRGGRVKDTRVP